MKKSITFLTLLIFLFTNIPLTTSFAETSEWNTTTLPLVSLEDKAESILKYTKPNGNCDGANKLDFALEIINATCTKKGSTWVIVTNATPNHRLHIWGDHNVDKQYTITSNSFQVTDIQVGTYSMKIL